MATDTYPIPVLICNRRADELSALADALRREDDRFIVETIGDPDDALSILDESTIDCVVVVGDPASSPSVEFIESIRDRNEELPVVLCGEGRFHPDAVDAALAAGVTDIVDRDDSRGRVSLLAHRIAAAVATERAAADAARHQRRVDQFVNSVSHDLRNPLNVAQGRLQLASGEGVDGTDEHVRPAARAIDRALELIDDLVALAKQGTAPRNVTVVSLREIAESCWANVATGDATLVVEGDIRFRANPSRLKQLLENLIGNAVSHGGNDVTVTVGDISPMYTTTRAEAVIPTGFYVADDGPGIPVDSRTSVFEMGYSTGTDGTGFGLNIVREVAEAHGWTVTVAESAAGGARFEITGVETDS